jgi:hypothetical protein
MQTKFTIRGLFEYCVCRRNMISYTDMTHSSDMFFVVDEAGVYNTPLTSSITPSALSFHIATFTKAKHAVRIPQLPPDPIQL